MNTTTVLKYTLMERHSKKFKRGTAQHFNSSQDSCSTRYMSTRSQGGTLKHAPHDPLARGDQLLVEEDKNPSSYKELRADLDSVQAELKRLRGLSTLRDPILTFRTYIASTMGHDTWASLAAKLKLESRRGIPKLVHQELDKTLRQQGLSMATWDSVRAVADEGVAEFHRGTDIPAKTVLESVENNELVPLDLSNAKPAIIEILKFLDSIGF